MSRLELRLDALGEGSHAVERLLAARDERADPLIGGTLYPLVDALVEARRRLLARRLELLSELL